jgi:hypothetical protein
MRNTQQVLPTFIEFVVGTIGNDTERPAHAGGYCPFLQASGYFIRRCLRRFKKIFSLLCFPNIGSELFSARASPKPAGAVAPRQYRSVLNTGREGGFTFSALHLFTF